MAKKKNDIKIEFIGNNAESVTGSATLISFGSRKILFECGGIQEGKTPYENYKLNRNMVQKIKAKEIDTIILGHNHYDHIGNVCTIFKQNPNIKVLVPQDSKLILREMLIDSCYINQRDCEFLSKKYKDKVFTPSYYESDVEQMLQSTTEYSVGENHIIDENLSIKFVYSGHIFGACQCELSIKIGNITRKLLFTSDLGNVKTQDLKPFVQNFEPMSNGVIAICESTYGARSNISLTNKIISNDLEKVKTVVEQYCVQNHRRVLFPVFSLDKCPNVLWLLFQAFKDYEGFDTKIIIDSPLTNRLLDRYGELLQGEAKRQFDEMMSWDNIVRIVDPMQSKSAIKTMTNCCILSSGGMLQSGRSVSWALSLLPHAEDCILLSGYCGENTLGWRIKNGNEQKTITINGTTVKNRCQIVALKSQSGHMQRNDLLDYYSQLNVDKIYLVHGEMQGKLELAEDLKERISQLSKSTRVCVVNKGTMINL